ncbi:rhodanese-like domain-containing protein [Marinicrinis sediminis]|uniref:Rhodanese-like domain-containing protein n=1 Tax=Marinicrinis sediminis TaxID=1652465 RepID=A0ABW5R688_9BACL
MTQEVKTISTQAVKEQLAEQANVHYIDVREHEEVAEGKIAEAAHIPMGEIPDRLSEIPKDKTVVFICRSGARSGRVCEYLLMNGYDNVLNMEGGMLAYDAEE